MKSENINVIFSWHALLTIAKLKNLRSRDLISSSVQLLIVRYSTRDLDTTILLIGYQKSLKNLELVPKLINIIIIIQILNMNHLLNYTTNSNVRYNFNIRTVIENSSQNLIIFVTE